MLLLPVHLHRWVVDTGIDPTHVEFATPTSRTVENRWSYTAVNGCAAGEVCSSAAAKLSTDGHGHGSFCAGVVGGVSVGLAPEANVFGIKVNLRV